ncbi:TPA: hypothetical protein ACGO1J_002048 [Streptococcus suis]|nr:hypothetical protein [Streptococcus suis]HEM3608933.1 hypothetical protein [Streptococcus suis]HEM3617332.1 hypothetical protein [Streptococcus suis]HEM3619261.1 hypothetical protein [Streptococcus suis]HEM3621161.1 hypothetical protein [Streptococcus suis]
MKKRIITALMSLAIFSSIIGTAAPVLAASGNWTSVIQWDANGVSETGTVNRSGSTTFTLKVMRANGATIGSKTVRIGTNKSDVHICWGQPALDRYGEVITSSTSHDPWFNS